MPSEKIQVGKLIFQAAIAGSVGALCFITVRGVVKRITGLAQLLPRSRVAFQDNQYLVSVRYGQWYNLQDFVQPGNPDVMAVYSKFGPDYWSLYDYVCRNIDYRRDWGEFWQTPSETLAKGQGDCEDCAFLLTSLIRVGGAPNCYVALGSLGGYGHAWCEYNGQVMETTYTLARHVPHPGDYCPYVLFSDQEVVELWPGALGEVFGLGRNEELKLEVIRQCFPELVRL